MFKPSHLLISSEDRDLITQSHSNFSVTLPSNIENAHNLVLCSALIPNTFYNIVTGLNDTFLIDSNLITIPQSLYNLNELGAQITTLIQALGGVYTTFQVGFDPLKLRGYFSNSTPFVIDFTNSKIAILLGFYQQLYSSTTFLEGYYPININTLNILIHVDICSAMSTTNKNIQTATFIIPVNVNKAEYIYFNQQTQFQLVAKSTNQLFNRLNFRLTDTSNNPLVNCGSWFCVLQFDYRSDVNIKLCSDSN